MISLKLSSTFWLLGGFGKKFKSQKVDTSRRVLVLG